MRPYPDSMAAEQPQVQQAPISCPRPELGAYRAEGAAEGRTLLGYIVWGVLGAVIAIIELLAAIDSDSTPWPTLSSTVGGSSATTRGWGSSCWAGSS